MKRGNPRSGTVDGRAFPNLGDMALFLGVNHSYLCKRARACGDDFYYRGRHIVLTPRYPRRERVPDPLARPVAPPPPREPLATTLAARRAYDEHGVARIGLLARRPA